MSEVSDFLLEQCFWEQVDKGIAAGDTGLFSGRLDNRSLVEILRTRFGLSDLEAQFEIEAARHEVQL